MIFAVLLLCIAAAFWLPHRLTEKYGYRGLTYSLAFSETEANEGDTVILTETICSRKWLPLPWVKAELTTHAALALAADHSAVSEETRFISSYFCLFPYRRIERRWKVQCTQRGIFQVGHAVIVLSDLFAAAEHSRPYPEAFAEIRVLPAVREELLPADYPKQICGDILLRRMLIPDRFAVCGIRPYADGDPVRDLSWTATARAGEPMVWQYQETAVPCITVMLRMETRETDIARVSDRALHEEAIRLCAAYLAKAAAQQIPVRFLANTELDGRPAETAYSTGEDAKLAYLRLLSALPDTISFRFGRLLRRVCNEEDAAAVIVVTAQPDAFLLQTAAAEPRVQIISLKPVSCDLPNVQQIVRNPVINLSEIS